MKRKYVLITTKHRGVFAGELLETLNDGVTVRLANARCAIRWNTTGGFLELASKGPNPSSKLGAVAKEITLYDVTSMATCSEVAEKAWRAAA